jgi:hypothetical protein
VPAYYVDGRKEHAEQPRLVLPSGREDGPSGSVDLSVLYEPYAQEPDALSGMHSKVPVKGPAPPLLCLLVASPCLGLACRHLHVIHLHVHVN